MSVIHRPTSSIIHNSLPPKKRGMINKSPKNAQIYPEAPLDLSLPVRSRAKNNDHRRSMDNQSDSGCSSWSKASPSSIISDCSSHADPLDLTSKSSAFSPIKLPPNPNVDPNNNNSADLSMEFLQLLISMGALSPTDLLLLFGNQLLPTDGDTSIKGTMSGSDSTIAPPQPSKQTTATTVIKSPKKSPIHSPSSKLANLTKEITAKAEKREKLKLEAEKRLEEECNRQNGNESYVINPATGNKVRRNYKNMTRERRIQANARERSRVHTIGSAFDQLRGLVPALSTDQKLSKLSILRIACAYILLLGAMNGKDYSQHQDGLTVEQCLEKLNQTIVIESKALKRGEGESPVKKSKTTTK